MPTAVLMMIGQIEVMKITKIADGCAVAEGRQRDRQPGQRRHGAQHLEDRVEPAHGPDRLADDGAEQDADDGGEAEADGDALQRGQHAPAEADVLRTGHEERIDDQILGVVQILRGAAGSRSGGRAQQSARRSRISASVISGGTTRAATAAAIAGDLDAKRLRGGAGDRQHFALASAGTAVAAGLSTGMFIWPSRRGMG